MKIERAKDRGTLSADPAYFTGHVWQERVIATPGAAPVAALIVGFAPAARTHWHTHPGGQTLHVLAGHGIVARRDGEAVAIAEGDTVWIEPGEEHWHGASPGRRMVHLAMQHVVDGSPVTWLEAVSEVDYAAAAAAADLPG